MAQKDWTILKSHTCAYVSEVFQISPFEFIAVSGEFSAAHSKFDGIYKYSLISNEWIKIIDYSKQFKPRFVCAAFDQANNTIYLGNIKRELWKINLKTKQMELLASNSVFSGYPSIYFADNVLHILTEENSPARSRNRFLPYIPPIKSHYIFDPKDNTFLKLSDIPFMVTPNCGIFGQNMIHLKTRQSLILFTDNIYEYSLVDKNWTAWDVFGKYEHGAPYGATITLTKNEKYILIITGNRRSSRTRSRCGMSDGIMSIDIETQSRSHSVIKVPQAKSYKGIIMNNGYLNDLLVSGWIREVDQKANRIPNDIIKLIKAWLFKEYLHLVSSRTIGEAEHFKIDIEELPKMYYYHNH